MYIKLRQGLILRLVRLPGTDKYLDGQVLPTYAVVHKYILTMYCTGVCWHHCSGTLTKVHRHWEPVKSSSAIPVRTVLMWDVDAHPEGSFSVLMRARCYSL